MFDRDRPPLKTSELRIYSSSKHQSQNQKDISSSFTACKKVCIGCKPDDCKRCRLFSSEFVLAWFMSIVHEEMWRDEFAYVQCELALITNEPLKYVDISTDKRNRSNRA